MGFRKKEGYKKFNARGLFSRKNFIIVEDALQLSKMDINENAHTAGLQYYFAVKIGAKIWKYA